jgi:two-component system, response regulator YesN
VPNLNSRSSAAGGNRGDINGPARHLPSLELLTEEMLDGRVRKILQQIESGKNLAITDLALEFNLSPSYLQRLFRQQTGFGMKRWLSERRLQRAADLLVNSYMSVKEIAYGVGYEHVSSFIRAFERRFARAPASFRKQSNRTKC